MTGNLDRLTAVAIDSLDRIVVAGYVSVVAVPPDFAVARYTTTGALDSTFNAAGSVPGIAILVFSGAGTSNDQANAVAIDGLGRIVVGGTSNATGATQFALARYNSSGTLDPNFGLNGIRVDAFPVVQAGDTNPASLLNGLAIDANNNVVAAGSAKSDEDPCCEVHYAFAFARYLAVDGELDPGFGTGGQKLVRFDLGSTLTQDSANAVRIDAEGNIVAGGYVVDDDELVDLFALARLTPAGLLDSTFVGAGKVTTPFQRIQTPGNADARAFALAIDGQGRIVLAGQSNADGNTEFALARYIGADANLQITKTADVTEASKGDTITYAITVKNNGPHPSQNVIMTDNLPSSLAFVSCTSTGTCGGTGNSRTVTFASLAKDQTEVIMLKATVNAGLAQNSVIANTATVAADTADSAVGNNTSTANVTVKKRADISVTKSASPTAIIPGDNVTYTIVVTNNGPDDAAANVVVVDTLPSAVTFVSCESTLSGVCAGTAAVPTVTLTTLAAGASATITLVVKANAGLADNSSLVNSVNASAVQLPDPNTANNTATATVVVHNRADLSVASSVAKTNNRQITYTLNVVNNGPYDARALVLTDVIPQGTVFASLVPGPWSCTAPGVGATGNMKCTLAVLPSTPPGSASASTALTVKVNVNGKATIVNVANITAATYDPVGNNNSITLTTKFSTK